MLVGSMAVRLGDAGWLRDLQPEVWVPAKYRGRPYNIFETGGTTGMPKQRIGWDDYKTDYEEFSAKLNDEHFPHGGAWLMVGPTGPRRLRLAIEHLANFRGSSCYFIDLDPRWVKKVIAEKKFDQARAYMDHVVEQGVTLLKHRKIAGLFTARGYNIDSLVVGETEDPQLSRMTFVVVGDDNVLEQVRKQLEKIEHPFTVAERVMHHRVRPDRARHLRDVAAERVFCAGELIGGFDPARERTGLKVAEAFMVRGEYPAGFRVRHHAKDLRICRDMAARHGVELSVVEATLAHYRRLIEQGISVAVTGQVGRGVRERLARAVASLSG